MGPIKKLKSALQSVDEQLRNMRESFSRQTSCFEQRIIELERQAKAQAEVQEQNQKRAQQQITALRQGMQALEKRADEARGELTELWRCTQALEKRADEARGELTELWRCTQALEKRADEAREELTELWQCTQALEKRADEAREELTELWQCTQALERRTETIQSQENQLTQYLERLRHEAEQFNQEFSSHKQLQWHMQFYYDNLWAQAEYDRVEAIRPGNQERLRAIKNKYKGKRCFIIGNGPSLRASDLDKLKNEYTFACNRIDLIFSETNWRPNFYCISDPSYFDIAKERCSHFDEIHTFLASDYLRESARYSTNVTFYPFNRMYRKIPEFSMDVSQIVYEGGTVTYVEIQLAVYMGFSEIYLLGVDNTINTKKLADGRIGVDHTGQHFYSGNDNREIENAENAWFDLSNRERCGLYDWNDTYATAKWHTEQIGVKIFNATRGGALEVFPRVDFDKCFG